MELKMNKIQEYTYNEIESFVLSNLYYSMGVDRIKYYEYNSLLVPRLKETIKRVAESRHLLFSDRNHTTFQDSSEYTSYDIDAIIKMIKRKYEMFGDYEGYKKIVDGIKMFSFSS